MNVVCEKPLYIDELKSRLTEPAKIQIISHDDMDGYIGAAVIYNELFAADISRKSHIRIGHYNYSDKIPSIDKDADIVFIIDYSISNKAFMDDLLSAYERGNQMIYWCDHHQTSIDLCTGKYEKLKSIPGIRSTKFCGAALAWFFMNPGTTVKKLPYFLQLVDDFDCWKKRIPESDALNAYFNATFYNTGFDCLSNPTNHMIGKLLTDTSDNLFFENIIREGKSIMHYDKQRDYANIRRNGWIGVLDKFPDIQMICLNNDSKGSQLFSDLFKSKENPYGKYDYACAFQFNGSKFSVSIYSSDKASPNAQKICEAYGGGGHPGAAGFSTNKIFVKKIAEIPDIIKFYKLSKNK